MSDLKVVTLGEHVLDLPTMLRNLADEIEADPSGPTEAVLVDSNEEVYMMGGPDIPERDRGLTAIFWLDRGKHLMHRRIDNLIDDE